MSTVNQSVASDIRQLHRIHPESDIDVIGYAAFAAGYGSTPFGGETGEMLVDVCDDYDACRRAAAHHSAGTKATPTAAVYALVSYAECPKNPPQTHTVKLMRTYL